MNRLVTTTAILHLSFAAPAMRSAMAERVRTSDCVRDWPEKEPAIMVARIVDSILIENQRIGKRTDLQQSVPVGGVAGQPRDL